MESEKYTLPKSCRLHPDNDVYREQEGHMDELRPMQWQCRYCKKMFRTQGYLDMHFDNRHFENLDSVSFCFGRCVSEFSFISFVIAVSFDLCHTHQLDCFGCQQDRL